MDKQLIARRIRIGRNVFFRQSSGYIATNIYAYSKLQTGNIIVGPAIIEDVDTTTVIPPGFRGTINEYLNIIIKKEA